MNDSQATFRLTGPDIDRNQITVTRAGIVIGRTAGNDLMLRHSQISRRHLRIYWQDGAFWAEDLGSTNGVWFNNDRMQPNEPHQLTIGDTLRLGPFVMVLEDVSEVGAIAPPPGDEPVRHDSNGHRMDSQPAASGIVEFVPVTTSRRLPSSKPAPSPHDSMIPRVKPRLNRYPDGIPRDQSNWVQYLPGIFSDPNLDPTGFMGRYLLIFESLLSPITWMIDNFDMYLSPETAPPEWMRWMASWFDVSLLPEIPVERQREIMRQIGWLFLRRGTRVGLERLLELYFGVKPEINEDTGDPCHFYVRLPLSQSDTSLGRDVVEQIIDSQKPAFTNYTLDIT